MSETFIDINEVALNNNCPECYSTNGLHLKFKQKIIDTNFYKSITSKIEHEITCKTCNSIIYPVQWTGDIERVFEYQKKAFTPKPKSSYLKKRARIIIGVIIGIAFLIAGAVFYNNL